MIIVGAGCGAEDATVQGTVHSPHPPRLAAVLGGLHQGGVEQLLLQLLACHKSRI